MATGPTKLRPFYELPDDFTSYSEIISYFQENYKIGDIVKMSNNLFIKITSGRFGQWQVANGETVITDPRLKRTWAFTNQMIIMNKGTSIRWTIINPISFIFDNSSVTLVYDFSITSDNVLFTGWVIA